MLLTIGLAAAAWACPYERLNAETIAAIGKHVARGPLAEEATPGSAQAFDLLRETVSTATEACGDEQSWSNDERQMAFAWSLANAAMPSVRTRLKSLGVESSALDRA